MKFRRIGSYLLSALLLTGILQPVAQADSSQPQLASNGNNGGNEMNVALGKPYTVSEPANDPYPDTGGELTDGVLASDDPADEAWTGFYKGSSRVITIDLGSDQSVSSIRANFLQIPSAKIQYPNAVSIYTSKNGKDWTALKHAGPPVAFWIGVNPPRYTFEWDAVKDGVPGGGDKSSAAFSRYVKVRFTTKEWVLLDEIQVIGQDGHIKGATVPHEKEQYLQPGAQTGGISNLALLYNGHYNKGLGDWTTEKLIPYLAHVDQNGTPTDWLFDGILYLGLSSPAGRSFAMSFNGSNWDDWKWYLDKTFATDGDLDALNVAVGEVMKELGKPGGKSNEKYPVVLMVPYPAEPQTNFGDVDGDGITENFNASQVGADASLASKKKAVDWYIDQLIQRWDAKGYDNLNLAGLYWLNEEVAPDGTNDAQLIKHASNIVHDNDLLFYWIPHLRGYQFFSWKELGFDAVAYQPNYFFQADSPLDRIRDAADWAKSLGMGMEMEFDERILTDANFRQKYYDYLNGAIQFDYAKDTFRAYYQGNDTLLQAARSDEPAVRATYDDMYKFIKGKYRP